jgi:hypothetical protein
MLKNWVDRFAFSWPPAFHINSFKVSYPEFITLSGLVAQTGPPEALSPVSLHCCNWFVYNLKMEAFFSSQTLLTISRIRSAIMLEATI